MNMLTSGTLGPLLSPDPNDIDDTRPITDSARIINQAQVAYRSSVEREKMLKSATPPNSGSTGCLSKRVPKKPCTDLIPSEQERQHSLGFEKCKNRRIFDHLKYNWHNPITVRGDWQKHLG